MKKFEQKTKIINGKEYTAQFNGLSATFEMNDNCKMAVDGVIDTSQKKIVDYILENVIVKPPHLKIDDFDTIEEMTEVVKFGSSVLTGRFQEVDEAVEEGTKGTSKK